MPDPPQTEVQFFFAFWLLKKKQQKKRQNDCGVTFHCFFGGDTGVLICRNSFGSIPTIGKQFAKTNENYCLFGINVPEFTQSCHREVQNEVNIFFFPSFFFFFFFTSLTTFGLRRSPSQYERAEFRREKSSSFILEI